MFVLLVDETLQEQWAAMVTALLSLGENIAMEYFIQSAAGIGTAFS